MPVCRAVPPKPKHAPMTSGKRGLPLDRATVAWAVKHAAKGPDSIWRCRETKVPLRVHYEWRTIGVPEDFPFNGLEVKRVGCVYCPLCTPILQFLRHGTPIALRNLVNYRP